MAQPLQKLYDEEEEGGHNDAWECPSLPLRGYGQDKRRHCSSRLDVQGYYDVEMNTVSWQEQLQIKQAHLEAEEEAQEDDQYRWQCETLLPSPELPWHDEDEDCDHWMDDRKPFDLEWDDDEDLFNKKSRSLRRRRIDPDLYQANVTPPITTTTSHMDSTRNGSNNTSSSSSSSSSSDSCGEMLWDPSQATPACFEWLDYLQSTQREKDNNMVIDYDIALPLQALHTCHYDVPAAQAWLAKHEIHRKRKDLTESVMYHALSTIFLPHDVSGLRDNNQGNKKSDGDEEQTKKPAWHRFDYIAQMLGTTVGVVWQYACRWERLQAAAPTRSRRRDLSCCAACRRRTSPNGSLAIGDMILYMCAGTCGKGYHKTCAEATDPGRPIRLGQDWFCTSCRNRSRESMAATTAAATKQEKHWKGQVLACRIDTHTFALTIPVTPEIGLGFGLESFSGIGNATEPVVESIARQEIPVLQTGDALVAMEGIMLRGWTMEQIKAGLLAHATRPVRVLEFRRTGGPLVWPTLDAKVAQLDSSTNSCVNDSQTQSKPRRTTYSTPPNVATTKAKHHKKRHRDENTRALVSPSSSRVKKKTCLATPKQVVTEKAGRTLPSLAEKRPVLVDEPITIKQISSEEYELWVPVLPSSKLGLRVCQSTAEDKAVCFEAFEQRSFRAVDGILPQLGDVIVSVDYVSTTSLSFGQVLAMLRDNEDKLLRIVKLQRRCMQDLSSQSPKKIVDSTTTRVLQNGNSNSSVPESSFASASPIGVPQCSVFSGSPRAAVGDGYSNITNVTGNSTRTTNNDDANGNGYTAMGLPIMYAMPVQYLGP